jgi:hypothetical protein
VLIGVWTRSTIAAILLTVLFWLMCFVFGKTEEGIGAFKLMMDQEATRAAREERMLNEAAAARRIAMTHPTTAEAMEIASSDVRRAELKRTREEAESRAAGWDKAYRFANAFKTVIPKTSETTDLLQRQLVKKDEMTALVHSQPRNRDDDEMAAKSVEFSRRHSATWIIGTSLLFEAVVLTLAAWIFCRRDY